MPQLIVRQIEQQLVQKLKERAARHGVSSEEEHRRILREVLTGKAASVSFKDYLLRMPHAGNDKCFQRISDHGRDSKL